MRKSHELEAWKFVVPEFVFGRDTRHLAGRYAKNFGLRKALVVTDPGVIAAGWTEQVLASLRDEGVSYTTFSHVTPNPSAEDVMAGADVYRDEHCNGIVAVGGGSPMDCAKGIGIVSTNDRHILEFEGVDRVPIPGPPLICVPTTAGSSADVSQFALITNRQQKTKITIASKTLVPDVALIDPLTTTTMSPSLTAETGFDALSHAIEAFVSCIHSPLTDLHSLEAIRVISTNLPRVLQDQDNLHLRTQQMLGSMEAGLAFSNASLGAVHAMSHSVGGFLKDSHGALNAVLLGPVIAFNFDAAAKRYSQVGEAMGLNLRGMSPDTQKSTLLDAVNRFRKAVGVDQTLGQIGLRRSDIPELAKKTMKDPSVVTNPRQPSEKDIEALFEQAL